MYSPSSSSPKQKKIHGCKTPLSLYNTSSKSSFRIHSNNFNRKSTYLFGSTPTNSKSLGRITTAEKSFIKDGNYTSNQFKQKLNSFRQEMIQIVSPSASPRSKLNRNIEKLNREIKGNQSFKQMSQLERSDKQRNNDVNNKSSNTKVFKLFDDNSMTNINNYSNANTQSIKNLTQRCYNTDQNNNIKAKMQMVVNAINNAKI